MSEFLLYYGLVFQKLLRFKNPYSKVFSILPLFWFLVSLTWGHLFNVGTNFVQLMVLLTLIGICCHPELYVVGDKLPRDVYALENETDKR